MSLKRKHDIESDDCERSNVKQVKLVPFPNHGFDTDVDMEIDTTGHHTRLSSFASSCSSSSDDSSTYPAFNLYPQPFFDGTNTFPSPSSNSPPLASPEDDFITPPKIPVGLMQPSSLGTTLSHHGTNCSQIPKLRVACAPGLNGHRTMWSFCEQCGAISMVDSD